jgi:2,4-dienoyl-CoA reductase-like NADH-dependent reductase (Old Yellow Enzyme family)
MSEPVPSLHTPLAFRRGPAMPNRLALAPLTNLQSHDDGNLSEDEFGLLVKRAAGGFGMVMTCAATTHALGKGFPRQLGVHDDAHLPGLECLATALRTAGASSSVQLQHSGGRAPRDLIPGTPVSAIILAGLRAERAGFDGVEVHGAHGYLLCQFLDTRNLRPDRYGGSAVNRSRMLREVIAGLRARARPDFQIGVRLSPERYGIDLGEARALAARLLRDGEVEYVDISCWDTFKLPEDPAWQARDLIGWFADLDRHGTALGVAGKLTNARNARQCLARGADFVLIGRGAILHHDFARRVGDDDSFASAPLPISRAHLVAEGLGRDFIDYMATWPGFVAEEEAA